MQSCTVERTGDREMRYQAVLINGLVYQNGINSSKKTHCTNANNPVSGLRSEKFCRNAVNESVRIEEKQTGF